MQLTIQTITTAARKRLDDFFLRRRAAQWQHCGAQPLDGHALRDLGVDRSECGSYLAEATGRADATRRRLATPR
jgi:hypothetical protein